jgi:hypothetical protein
VVRRTLRGAEYGSALGNGRSAWSAAGYMVPYPGTVTSASMARVSRRRPLQSIVPQLGAKGAADG